MVSTLEHIQQTLRSKAHIFPSFDIDGMVLCASSVRGLRSKDSWVLIFEQALVYGASSFDAIIYPFNQDLSGQTNAEYRFPDHHGLYLADGRELLGERMFRPPYGSVELVIHGRPIRFDCAEPTAANLEYSGGTISESTYFMASLFEQFPETCFIDDSTALKMCGYNPEKWHRVFFLTEWEHPHKDDHFSLEVELTDCIVSMARALAEDDGSLVRCPEATANTNWKLWTPDY